jgi:membrane protein
LVLIALIQQYVRQLDRHDTTGLAAELAFRFMFATFPFVLFLAALGAFMARWLGVTDPTAGIISTLGRNIPSDLVGPINTQLNAVLAHTQPGLLSVGALVTVYAAAGGINALMKAMNRAFGVQESRLLPVRIALGAGLTVVGGFGIVVGVVAIVGGTLMTTELADRAGIGAATWMAMSILRWPLAFAALVFAVMALFRYGSCVRSPWRWAAAGASAFAVAWIAVTFGFGLYVERLGNFDVTYGALGGVIVLMLWYYLTAIILLAAAELVALLAVTFDRDKPQDLEKIGVAPRDLEAESGEALSTPEEQQPTLPPPASPQPTPPPPHQPQ